MIYGYARVSSVGQAIEGNSLEMQERILREHGAAEICREVFTGTKKHRPQLDLLLSKLKDGDTVIVTKLDRIARSVLHGSELVKGLIERGVTVNVLNMGIMDNTPSGKLMRTVLFAFAEFERDMIVERTSEGKEIARLNPEYKEGRKAVQYDKDLFRNLAMAVNTGVESITSAARKLGVSRAKWYRIVKEVEARA